MTNLSWRNLVSMKTFISRSNALGVSCGARSALSASRPRYEAYPP
jgi:hypothetical protein